MRALASRGPARTGSPPHMKYVARRLLHSLFLLAGVSVLSFLFADLAPGDFFSEMRLDPASRQRRWSPCGRSMVWIALCPSVTPPGSLPWRAANSATRWPMTALSGRCSAANPGHPATHRDCHLAGLAAGGSAGHLERRTTRAGERFSAKYYFRFCSLSQNYYWRLSSSC